MLIACGGGGNAALSIALPLVAAMIYWLPVAIAFRRAEDAAERRVLLALFIVSAALGLLILLFPDNSPSLTRFVISLVATGGVGLAVAAKWREGIAGRAVAIAVAGDILIPGLITVVFIAALLGGACLE